MKVIYFASSNPEKIVEIGKILKEFDIDMIATNVSVPEDKNKDQEEIAKEKAKVAAERIGKPTIAEDAGIYFEAYDDKNFPGINSKSVFEELGIGGLLEKLKGKNRRAYFKSVVAYCEPGKEPIVFVGVCKGRITERSSGKLNIKLPYDDIFIPDGERENRTFSLMAKDEKAKYSHRAKSVRAFAEWFSKH